MYSSDQVGLQIRVRSVIFVAALASVAAPATAFAQQFTLTASKTGSGQVTSNPTGIDCGATCSAPFDNGASVTLVATAAAGWQFMGWGGACSGLGTCTVSMTQARSVSATFNQLFALTVKKAGEGTGTVTSNPPGINCGPTCSAMFTGVVTLTAVADGNSVFAGWSQGQCAGTGACIVSVGATESVRATFLQQDGAAPQITGQPANQAVAASQNASFTVAASGTPTLFYRWQRSTNGGGSWSDVAEVAPHSGTDTPTLTVSNITGAVSGALYRATVTNGAGSATSNAATLLATYQLTVARAGSGSGSITTSSAEIDCGTACDGNFAWASAVTLTATPAAGSIFTGWSGADASRTFTTFAGTVNTPGSANGTGTAARFSGPTGITFVPGSGAFVVDRNNHTVRRITADATVTTFAGSPGLTGTADGTGSAARFNNPYGIAAGSDGTLYLTDTNNRTIRKITTAGEVTTLAGSGQSGTQDGTGTNARFVAPTGIAISSNGTLFVTDGHAVRQITLLGVVTTIAGQVRASGFVDGAADAARFSSPTGIVASADGTIYVADRSNHVIRQLSNGIVSTLAGGAQGTVGGATDGVASAASFNLPVGVAIDGGGLLYVTEQGNNQIRTVTSSGLVRTLAGAVNLLVPSFGTIDDNGSAARFANPTGISVDVNGTMLVTSSAAHVIRRGVAACTGTTPTCTVSMYDAGAPITASFTQQFSLTVAKSGSGLGSVTSAPAGIDCGTSCSAAFKNGMLVTLTPTPQAGSLFTGWSGACTGLAACTVTMTQAREVTANFTQYYLLAVTTSGSGAGSVSSNPGGIDCGASCAANYAAGTLVTLTPTTGAGSIFVGWSGACTGIATCTVSMTTARNVTATFAQHYALIVTKAGNGAGTVTSSRSGIDCGATCVANFEAGAAVTLSAVSAAGSTFAGWSGACSGSAACTVTMTPAVAVTATFTAPPTATAEAFTTAFQTALVVPAPGLLGNDDANGGDGLTAVLVSNANHGTLTLSGDGGFSYTPNPQFVGSDTFSYSAINSAGTSNTVIVTIAVSQPTEPQPVSDFYVSSVVGNRVTVRWKSPTIGPVTTGFELAGGLSPGQVLATLPVPGTAPIFTFDAPTGVFHIRLHTIAGAARSAASNEVRLVVNVPEAPSAPADFAAVVDGSGLGLAWRSTFLGGAATTFVVDATGTLNVSVPVGALQTAIFADVPAGTYTLTLRATNDGGASAASNPVTISIPSACSGAPLPPSNALAYTVGDVLTVVWDPATSGPAATSFLVNVAGSIVSSVPVSSRTFSSSLPVGQYHLTVQATNSCGTSAPTASQMVQIP